MSKKHVTVLMGGPDAERDVSIRSGMAVAQALKNSGEFFVEEQIIDIPSLEDIANIQCDIVFPVLHGPFGEGGPLQQLLENAGKIFVGSSSKSAELAMDKSTTKQIAIGLGIQTPKWCVLNENDTCDLPLPFVLKPIDDGSSVDVEFCNSTEDVQINKTELFKTRKQLLAEEYIQGRELTVGIINGEPLPIIEIIPPNESYDFVAKYQSEDTQYVISPNLPTYDCVNSAMKLYEEMNILDIARVDFLLDDRGSWLLEINTMPGFTNHSLVPMAAKHIGITMDTLCASLVHAAMAR